MKHAKTRREALGALLATGAVLGCGLLPALAQGSYKVAFAADQWRRRLSPAQYEILRESGTEPAFSSPLDHETRGGRYVCAGCATPLFSSQTKFDSGTGWPSFYAPLSHAVLTTTDHSFFMVRTEVHCATCGGHLGHLFDDGPKPTGLRYCMNGLAMNFRAGKT